MTFELQQKFPHESSWLNCWAPSWRKNVKGDSCVWNVFDITVGQPSRIRQRSITQHSLFCTPSRWIWNQTKHKFGKVWLMYYNVKEELFSDYYAFCSGYRWTLETRWSFLLFLFPQLEHSWATIKASFLTLTYLIHVDIKSCNYTWSP